ncbi:hypothetical protein CBM2592_P90005 [Cupriavidus taiwanensis]|uniref:Uncharacterized protein n=2 Tax=Cupriavidus TaxID=106589 RepID=A0A375CPV7_9BURK|nr:hypothetical protein CBM2588_P70043 [Cupriavidus taiwanensis]SOZ40793.1 hypothetical protein CBM2605_P60043 [Cupriavidus neocaledonicus]SOY76962.1 hypothetical protein CBM2585_P70022 [Cupriavidus taiwanensis]SOY77003.1 hypothetical protein CBM2592_P90005 [Cupriavidus taiwanensis]SOY77291.1 hypothetical protein CBM2589_P60042 [Cupriavidus taiwanensis]
MAGSQCGAERGVLSGRIAASIPRGLLVIADSPYLGAPACQISLMASRHVIAIRNFRASVLRHGCRPRTILRQAL